MNTANLGHDVWVWLSNRVSPLHSDGVPPHLDLATHQAAASLCCGLVILVLQETEATVLLLVVRLVVQYHLLETLCKMNTAFFNFILRQKKNQAPHILHGIGSLCIWTWPVTLPKSSNILSLVLFFGIDPTNRRLFATDIHTPKYLPGRISWLSHWKQNGKTNSFFCSSRLYFTLM